MRGEKRLGRDGQPCHATAASRPRVSRGPGFHLIRIEWEITDTKRAARTMRTNRSTRSSRSEGRAWELLPVRIAASTVIT